MNEARLSEAEQADIEVGRAVAIDPDGRLGQAIHAVGHLGDQPPLAGAAGFLLGLGLGAGDRRLSRAGVRMLASFALDTAAKNLLKNSIDRTRPHRALASGDYRLEPGDSSDKTLRSFPSGHTAGTSAVARALARDYPALALPAAAGAVTIGAAQLPQQKHWLSDVLAGAAIGLAGEWLVSAALDRLWPAEPRP